MNQQVGNWVLLIVLAFIWGSSFILMFEGLFDSEGQPLYTPWQVGAMRIAFAGLVLLPVAIRMLPKISLRDYGWMALVGLVGNTVPAFCFTYAETRLDSNFAGILNGLVPFFALLVGALLFRSPVRWIQVGGIAIGLIGATGLTFLQDVDLGGSWVHIAVVIGATVFYGVSINIIHHKTGTSRKPNDCSICAVDRRGALWHLCAFVGHAYYFLDAPRRPHGNGCHCYSRRSGYGGGVGYV